jgi:hypothetical protein
MNCFFKGLTGSAFNMTVGTMPGYSNPEFINNTVVDCDKGIFAQDPYDAFVRNNIFYGNNTAVERTNGQSSDVVSNCFFNNDTDFIGYPSSYGTTVMLNRNGDPCDIAFNIFEDPLFIQNGDYLLMGSSPCIEAGTSERAPAIDIDGDSRPQDSYFDIGADEWISCSIPVGHLEYCRDCGPCSEGQGNCEGDAECQGDLICAQNVGADYGWPAVIDVCEQPPGGGDTGGDDGNGSVSQGTCKAMPFIPLLLLDN